MWLEELKFETLKGLTFKDVRNVDNQELIFEVDNGERYKLFHDQMCCEGVSIEDICGDLKDLIGSPITLAEEAVSNKDPEDFKKDDEWRDSYTWTFYKLSTVKGSVTIRWYGESNGYYSESVQLSKILAKTTVR